MEGREGIKALLLVLQKILQKIIQSTIHTHGDHRDKDKGRAQKPTNGVSIQTTRPLLLLFLSLLLFAGLLLHLLLQ